jgi:hypothetical protein
MKKMVCALMWFALSFTLYGGAGAPSVPKIQAAADGYDWVAMDKTDTVKVYSTINPFASAAPMPVLFYRCTLIEKPGFVDYQIDKVYKYSYKIYGTSITMYEYDADLTLFSSQNAVPGLYVMKLLFFISGSSTFPDYGTEKDSLIIDLAIRPQLVSPVLNGLNQPKDVVFRWNKAVHAVKYISQLSNDDQFAALVKKDSTTTDTTKTITGLSGGQKYYWRVYAVNADRFGAYSHAWNFTTRAAAPNAPVAIAATSLAAQTGFTANWNAAADASGYFLDVATNNVFSSFVAGFNNKDVLNVTKYPVSGLKANTTYYYRVRAKNDGGTSANSNTITVVATGIGQDAAEMPAIFGLEQNFPNPFNPGTTIQFSLPETAQVTLKIFNAAGKEVAQLVSQKMNAGTYKAEWDASGFVSGIYYCRIVTDRFSETKKMLLLK